MDIPREKIEQIAPVLCGVVLIGILFFIGDYVSIWGILLVLISGIAVSELLCRIYFHTTFLKSLFPHFFKKSMKSDK